MKHLICYAGQRISLAVMQERYIEDFAVWANRGSGLEATLIEPPYDIESGREWLKQLRKNRDQEAFAVLRNDAKGSYTYLGHVGIHRINWAHRHGVTGSAIAHPKGQGRGYGTEAKLLFQQHAGKVMGLRKLQSDVKAFNAQSVGHLLKCGYRYCGRYRSHVFHRGAFVDELLFEAFPEDWDPIFERYKKTGELPKLTKAQKKLIERECSVT